MLHVYLQCLGAHLAYAQCLKCILNLKCESISRRFQQKEGPSRHLLHDCENFADGLFAALIRRDEKQCRAAGRNNSDNNPGVGPM